MGLQIYVKARHGSLGSALLCLHTHAAVGHLHLSCAYTGVCMRRYAVPYAVAYYTLRGGDYEVMIELTAGKMMETGGAAFAERYQASHT